MHKAHIPCEGDLYKVINIKNITFRILYGSNNFFKSLGKFLVWFFFENIIVNIPFPFSHKHFHEMINLDKIFGS